MSSGNGQHVGTSRKYLNITWIHTFVIVHVHHDCTCMSKGNRVTCTVWKHMGVTENGQSLRFSPMRKLKPAWMTFKPRNNVRISISQSPRATLVLRHSLTSFLLVSKSSRHSAVSGKAPQTDGLDRNCGKTVKTI